VITELNELFDLVLDRSKLERGVLKPFAALARVESDSPNPAIDDAPERPLICERLSIEVRYLSEREDSGEPSRVRSVSNLTESGRDEGLLGGEAERGGGKDEKEPNEVER